MRFVLYFRRSFLAVFQQPGSPGWSFNDDALSELSDK